MEELKFQRRQLKMDVYGEEVVINYPTVKEFKTFTDQSKEENKGFDGLVNFLEKMGMRRDLAESLEPEHLNKIIEKVTEGDGKK